MQNSSLSGRALVVDDQQTLLSVAEDMLTARGMEVLLADNGPQAIDLFQAHHDEINVVLLDFKMPNMNGAEIFTKLREIKPDVQVVISSGYSEEETSDFFSKNPDVLFLQKPYRFHTLVETIATALAQSH